jgi:ABC-type nickel/cobalt efflux system permease component RcnA
MNCVAILIAQASGDEVTLTVTGAVIMTISVLLVLSFCTFCFWRILRGPRPSGPHHVPPNSDTRG